jgi:hypothetical protein
VVEPADVVAQLDHEVGVVGDEDDRRACLAQHVHVVHAAALELFIAHGDDLVDEENLGADVDRHREAEADVHAA